MRLKKIKLKLTFFCFILFALLFSKLASFENLQTLLKIGG